jgi:hypothetical protein
MRSIAYVSSAEDCLFTIMISRGLCTHFIQVLYDSMEGLNVARFLLIEY